MVECLLYRVLTGAFVVFGGAVVDDCGPGGVLAVCWFCGELFGYLVVKDLTRVE